VLQYWGILEVERHALRPRRALHDRTNDLGIASDTALTRGRSGFAHARTPSGSRMRCGASENHAEPLAPPRGGTTSQEWPQ